MAKTYTPGIQAHLKSTQNSGNQPKHTFSDCIVIGSIHPLMKHSMEMGAQLEAQQLSFLPKYK